MRLVYFAPVPWESYSQRPHAMVRFFVEQHGWEVLWVDPYPTRLPRWEDRHRLTLPPGAEAASGVGAVMRLTPRALPVEPLPGGPLCNRWVFWRQPLARIRAWLAGGASMIGVGRPSHLALRVVLEHPGVPSFYDAMDDFPAFFTGVSRRATARTEARLAAAVRRVFVSSPWLVEKFKGLGSLPQHVPNGCDTARLPPPCPRTQRYPILGYVGTIATWFDWDTTVRLAGVARGFEVVLIGPCFTAVPPGLPANVRVEPALAHDAALARMARFSVGLIPFRDTELTRAVDPIKYYEYQALDVPVLATPFGDFRSDAARPGVTVAAPGRDLAAALHLALDRRPDREVVEHVRQSADWRQRFRDMRLGEGL